MKKKKRLLSIILSFVFIFGIVVGFSSCIMEYEIFEIGYYICQISDDGKNEIDIIGLTDLGKEQEYLVVPEKINGRRVDAIKNAGYNIDKIREKHGEDYIVNYESDKLKKIFITSNIMVVKGFWSSGIVVKGYKNPSFEGWFYISNEMVEDYYGYRTSFLGGKMANVSYYYNYESAPNNGYYWIDNYNYAEKIEYVPENPMQDGYSFGGWYKEPECINAWDFETDTLPQAQYNEEGQELYQETKLYAKWIKN